MKNKKSIFRKIINVIGYAAIAAIAILLVFVMISNARGNVTFVFGRALVWVRTGSMEKTIPERSYILVKKADPKEIKVGDVIVFSSDDPVLGGAFNTHRVIEIIGDNEEFVTKGDNNPAQDEYTAKAGKVAAVYVRNMPVLSAFGRFMSTPIGVVGSMTSIFLLILLIYLPDVKNAKKEIDKQIAEKREAQIDALVKAEVERIKQEEAGKAASGNQREDTVINAGEDSGEKKE